jgi:hypothetical protein
MGIKAICKCGAQFMAKDELAGQNVNCPSCGQPFQVPRPQEVSRPAKFQVACPCGRAYQVSVSMAGKPVKCNACGQQFVIPQSPPPLRQSTPVPSPQFGSGPLDTLGGQFGSGVPSAPVVPSNYGTYGKPAVNKSKRNASNQFLILLIGGGLIGVVAIAGIAFATYKLLSGDGESLAKSDHPPSSQAGATNANPVKEHPATSATTAVAPQATTSQPPVQPMQQPLVQTASNQNASPQITEASSGRNDQASIIQMMEALYARRKPTQTDAPPWMPYKGRKPYKMDDSGAVTNVQLINSPATDADVARLAELSSLQDLSLQATHVTVECLASLAKLKNLQRLNIAMTNIGDESIPQFSKLTQLRAINVYGTKMSPAGMTDLATALPNCQVFNNRSLLW